MKEINQYLKTQSKELKRKTTMNLANPEINKIIKKKLSEDYNQWLFHLNNLMKNSLFRQTLKEIESKRNTFYFIKDELWKCRLIKAKAILKIIKIKMKKHPNEIGYENYKQNIALKFWFNQMFIILEELNLEFRYDINEHMDYKSKKIAEPVQKLIEYQLTFIYYLCIFSLASNEIIPLISYISIADKFLPYIAFFSKSKSLSIFQNIVLFKIKLLVENFEFISALENIKIVNKLCFREMLLYFDFDYPINISSFNSFHKMNKSIQSFCRIIQNLVLSYYLRAVSFEHLGFFKMSVHSYRRCCWLCNKFLFDYNKDLFKFFKNISKKSLIFIDIINDINKLISNKNNPNNEKKYLKYRINSSRIRMYNNSNSIIDNKNFSCISSYKNKKRRNSSIIAVKKSEQLKNLLENIGNNLYKEEENRNNSIFKKFTVNSFVLSTVNMIDNLLTNPFNHILKKMEKIEITKPKEDISELINWTINLKRQKEFKNEIGKMNKKYNKKHNLKKNKSCQDLNKILNLNKKSSYFPETKQSMILLKKKEIPENYGQKNNEKSLFNFIKKTKTKYLNNELNSYEKIIKLKLSSSKNKENKKVTNSKKKYEKILKYPLNKNVFSQSFRQKKYYLDSFYEKELKFQKKLLKLKGQNIEEVSKDYNQQKAIDSAEQQFRIMKSSVENTNTKKNLMNLVKNSEFLTIKHMFPDKKLRDRSNKKACLLKIKNYMKMNNINNSLIKRFDPNNVSIYNEEKSKILDMECIELELLQHKIETERKNLLNKSVNNKKLKNEKY